ncbi:MAG: hypothetical protein GXO97_06770 [Nitrospirae bacterium]|nr:hypothetical protein [Nitrospirota bacterium]
MRRFITMFMIVFFAFSCISAAEATELDSLIKLLIKKGIITEEEAGEIKREISKEAVTAAEEKTSSEISEEDSSPVSISGSIYGEYRWMRHRDITDPDTDSTSDLYLRKVELGTEVSLTHWAEASVVLNSEWIGDDINQGDEKVAVDEATLTLKGEGFPLYLVLGKRTQPFGVFENHLITDPMTQDAYETKRPGLTLGVEGPLGLDASLTVYKGEEQMNHLFESGLFEDTLRGWETRPLMMWAPLFSLSVLHLWRRHSQCLAPICQSRAGAGGTRQ